MWSNVSQLPNFLQIKTSFWSVEARLFQVNTTIMSKKDRHIKFYLNLDLISVFHKQFPFFLHQQSMGSSTEPQRPAGAVLFRVTIDQALADDLEEDVDAMGCMVYHGFSDTIDTVIVHVWIYTDACKYVYIYIDVIFMNKHISTDTVFNTLYAEYVFDIHVCSHLHIYMP